MNTLGALYLGLLEDNVTYLQTLAVGIDQTFFVGDLGKFESVYVRYFETAGISQEKAQEIYKDNIVGFGDVDTRKYWVQAVVRGWESPDSVHLMQYFGLENSQMISLLENLNKAVQAIKIALKNGYKCPGTECDSDYLTLIQLASQNITKYPPSGPSYASIVDTNATAFGYPEISYFLEEVFYKTISHDDVYKKDCNFTLDQMKILLNKTETGCAKSYHTLLHPTNIQEFMKAGFSFDKSQNIQDFAPVVERFSLNNVYQARILFEYLKYLAANFSTVDSLDFELTLRAQFFTQGILPIWTFAIDNLKTQLVNALAVENAKTQKLDCKTSIKLSSPMIDPVQLATFCMAGFDENTINRLFSWCGNQTTANYNAVFGSYNFKKISVSLICSEDSNPGSFAAFYNSVHASLSKNYACRNPGFCTAKELIAKQWVNGTVTTNPPKEIQSKFPISQSLASWYPKIIPSPFEFSVIGQDLVKISVDDAIKFLFWENAFAQAVVVKAIADARKGTMDFLNKKLFQTDVKAFEKYINTFIIDAVFGGISVKSTVRKFIEGYTSPLMMNVKLTNPLLGGDPSVDPTVSLVPYITVVDQARKTGANKIKDVDQFVSINGVSYINYFTPYFDGNQTSTMMVNPWKVEDTLQGSDNIYPSLLSTSSNPVAYITDLCRYGKTTYKKKTKNEKYGLESYRFAIDDSVLQSTKYNPGNDKYHMSVYNGAINLTSVQKSPIFATKLFMQMIDTDIVNKIQMIDVDSSTLEFNEETDDLYLEIQPDTGIPTKINFDLQTNVEMPYDTLFTDYENTLLPVFFLRRDLAELSDDQIHTIFGDVIEALNLVLYLKIFFVVLGVGMIATTFVVYSRNKALIEADDDDELRDPILDQGDKGKEYMSGTETEGIGSKLVSAAETEGGENAL